MNFAVYTYGHQSGDWRRNRVHSNSGWVKTPTGHLFFYHNLFPCRQIRYTGESISHAFFCNTYYEKRARNKSQWITSSESPTCFIVLRPVILYLSVFLSICFRVSNIPEIPFFMDTEINGLIFWAMFPPRCHAWSLRLLQCPISVEKLDFRQTLPPKMTI